MTPVALERFRPLVKRPDGLRVGSIEHAAAVAPHVDQAHLDQHPEVLRHRRLRHPQRIHNLPDRPLLQRQIVQNLPPPRLRHGIERIRRCRCSCHGLNNTFPYGNASSTFFLPPPSPLTLFRLSCSVCPCFAGPLVRTIIVHNSERSRRFASWTVCFRGLLSPLGYDPRNPAYASLPIRVDAQRRTAASD